METDFPMRKIIHVDMDAFYASVEQLDDSELRGKPVAVGGSSKRGVVAAASYEARKFGVRSAMSSVLAIRNCPQLIFVKARFDRYKEINFLFPEFTEHSLETVVFFKKFCKDFNYAYKVLTDSKKYDIVKDIAYISVSDRVLGVFLEQCKTKNFEPGVDVGFLSYNETPMKEFIYKGISVVSTDFKAMGTKAAEFIMNDKPTQAYIETNLLVRESL